MKKAAAGRVSDDDVKMALWVEGRYRPAFTPLALQTHLPAAIDGIRKLMRMQTRNARHTFCSGPFADHIIRTIMFNLSMGSPKELGGKPYIVTQKGVSGHAVYGPYEQRNEGLFEAQFDILLVDAQGCNDHQVCATVEVTGESGQLMIASRGVTVADVQRGLSPVKLEFRLDAPQTLEYRVYCDGSASLLIGDNCQVADFGLSTDQYIAKQFKDLPENDYYEAMYGGSASMRQQPGYIGMPSSICRQLHFSLDEFRYWAAAMGRKPRLHRKDWEWFFIAQTLFEVGMLEAGKQGLGFAVGREPLPALFASWGCDILATD